MKPRMTLILAIILVILGGYAFWLSRENNEQDPAGDQNDWSIYETKYGEYDIVELEVGGSPGIVHFARTKETPTQDWARLLPTPLGPDELDQVRVNGAAVRMGQLTASQVITTATNLAQYGLDAPELTVTLTISSGQKITLYTGSETPVGGSRYLRLADDPASVYLVFSFAVDDLRRLIEDPPLAPTPLP